MNRLLVACTGLSLCAILYSAHGSDRRDEVVFVDRLDDETVVYWERDDDGDLRSRTIITVGDEDGDEEVDQEEGQDER